MTGGLTGLGDPADHFLVDLGGAVEDVAHELRLGAVHFGLGCDVGSLGWRLVHYHYLLSVNDQAEVPAGGGEEIHAPSHVSFSSCIKGAVIGEQKFVNGGCGYTRLKVHPPLIEEVVVRPVGDADPSAFFMECVHQPGRKHEADDDSHKGAALLHSVGHCECL
ncbi:hypothetical protein SprV_0100482400 [Sparganum proliferum]